MDLFINGHKIQIVEPTKSNLLSPSATNAYTADLFKERNNPMFDDAIYLQKNHTYKMTLSTNGNTVLSNNRDKKGIVIQLGLHGQQWTGLLLINLLNGQEQAEIMFFQHI